MRAVLVDAPAELLEERARLGLDVRDEMWEGVLHMVPPTTTGHQLFASDLLVAIRSILGETARVGLEAGVRAPGSGLTSYRVPDLFVVRTERAEILRSFVEGAPDLAVEIRSPGDESLEKLPFYARLGVPEVLIIERDTKEPRLFRLAGAEYLSVSRDRDGKLLLDGLDLAFRREEGPVLLVTSRDGSRTARA